MQDNMGEHQGRSGFIKNEGKAYSGTLIVVSMGKTKQGRVSTLGIG